MKIITVKQEFIVKENTTLFKALNVNLGLNFVEIKKILRKKDIKVDNKRVLDDCEIKMNQVVTCYIQFKLDIIYEDDNILVINKPKKIETISLTNSNNLTSYLNKIYNFVKPCHRLDTNTDGVNVFAKNEKSYNEILSAFKEQRVTKKYIAIVGGSVENGAILTDYLVKDSKNSVVKVYKNNSKNAIKIITEYQLIKKFNEDLCLIEVVLHTGKTHQIRAHLSSHGIYILGDRKYGNKSLNQKYKKNNQCLTSFSIIFDFLNIDELKYISGKEFKLNKNKEDFTI